MRYLMTGFVITVIFAGITGCAALTPTCSGNIWTTGADCGRGR